MRPMRVFWIAIGLLAGGLLLLLLNDEGGSILGIAEEDFARLVKLGALLLVLSAVFVVSRAGLGQAARNAAIWLLAILALVAGYQYRYELQDVASRVTAGLVPGSPISMRFEDGSGGVRVDRMAGGHFEVRGSVNGAPIDFLIDTGATTTVMTARDAQAAGYAVSGLAFNVPVATANGMARAARVTADDITVGSITRRRVPMLVAEDGRLGKSLLGMNFIGTLSGFDMRGDRMILRD